MDWSWWSHRPASSPDITIRDFFQWEHVNDDVHQIPADDIRGLKYRTETAGSFEVDML
jgi:hypothetical protein